MQVILTITKEFEDDWNKDRFADSLNRLCVDAHCLAGLYEKEVCRMLIDTFATATTVVKENDTAKLQGEWDMFQRITTAYNWKQCYFLQENGLVYSRLSHTTMTRDDAIKEFLNEVYND